MNIIRPLLLMVLCMRGCCTLALAQIPANDANKYQIIVVSTAASGVATWFDQVPELAKLKSNTAFTYLKPKASEQAKDGLFEARYKSVLGSDLPIIAFCRPDGGVIYFSDRNTMPSREKLYGEIKVAAELARKAVQMTAQVPLAPISQDDWAENDCVDGSCNVPLDSTPTPRFPRLQPLKNPQTNPLDRMISGWFSDSVTSGIFLVSSVVCLMVIVLFAVLIFGAMVVVVRWVVK